MKSTSTVEESSFLVTSTGQSTKVLGVEKLIYSSRTKLDSKMKTTGPSILAGRFFEKNVFY